MLPETVSPIAGERVLTERPVPALAGMASTVRAAISATVCARRSAQRRAIGAAAGLIAVRIDFGPKAPIPRIYQVSTIGQPEKPTRGAATGQVRCSARTDGPLGPF